MTDNTPAVRNDTISDPTLSICMIVKNEEKHIGNCLHKIKPLADEIIVVDTGSSDRTKQLAKIFGAKTYDFEWTNSFADARNYSLSKATGDWIFVLDADETIAPSDFEPLRKLIADSQKEIHRDASRLIETKKQKARRIPISTSLNQSQRVSSSKTAYSFISRNYVHPMNSVGWIANDGTYLKEEAGTGWFSSKKVRLFPNRMRVRFEAPVHEFVENSLFDAGIAVKNCDIPVHHYGKLDTEKIKAKGEQYFELGKLKQEERGAQDPVAIFELGVQASELGKYEEALTYFERIVSLAPTFPMALYGLGNTYFRLNKFAEAFSAAQRAIDIAQDEPSYRDAVILSAHSALCIGRAAEGIKNLNQFLKKYPNQPKYPDDPVLQLLFAVSYLSTGEKETGISYLRQLKEKTPGAAYLISDFVKILISSRQEAAALLALKTAQDINLTTSEFPALIAECEKKMKESEEETHRDSVETKDPEIHGDSTVKGSEEIT